MKEDGNGKTLYHLSGGQAIAETYSWAGGTNRYTHRADGLTAIQPYNSSVFVIKDHRGSTRLLVADDANKTVAATYDYLPFGGLHAGERPLEHRVPLHEQGAGTGGGP
ncbi:MAG: hypothetical protein IIB42_05305 [Candidatus Marinimicrobia bacterium]|nr:hypothetical protein [Candidatus Neomarinimicrobiota bacterium]